MLKTWIHLTVLAVLCHGLAAAGEDEKKPERSEKESKESKEKHGHEHDESGHKHDHKESKDAPKLTDEERKNLADDFALFDLDKKKRTLKEFAGKIVVLEWINHGCPFVKKHYDANNMQSLQKKYTAKGVVWLSICSSGLGQQGHMSSADWKKKQASLGAAPTAVLVDEDGQVGRLYKARTTPQFCIVNEKQVKIYEGAIDDKPRAFSPEDIATATNHVAATLDAALAGKPAPVRKTQSYG